MNMVEVKTAELSGAALDWAVAEAEGVQRFVMGDDWPGNSVVADAADRDRVVICNLVGRLVVSRGGWNGQWTPSTDWSQGGPLIESHFVKLEPQGAAWKAGTDLRIGGTPYVEATGPVALCAAMRAIVVAKLGDVVQVPAELVQEADHG